jgi:acyl carrier protein
MEYTRDAVLKVLTEALKPIAENEAAASDIRESTSLLDLKVNSARVIDLILSMENRFGIDIDDESASKTRTVGDMVRVIMQKLGDKKISDAAA